MKCQLCLALALNMDEHAKAAVVAVSGDDTADHSAVVAVVAAVEVHKEKKKKDNWGMNLLHHNLETADAAGMMIAAAAVAVVDIDIEASSSVAGVVDVTYCIAVDVDTYHYIP